MSFEKYVNNNNVAFPNREGLESASRSSKLNLDILLPNGILQVITVDKTITLFELKSLVLQKVFDPANSFPLRGHLTNEPAAYNLIYINDKGSRVEADDEDKSLRDLNIFLPLPYMQMVKCERSEKGNCAYREAGSLIGQNLMDIDKLGLEEVSDFRWKSKIRSKVVTQCRMKNYEENVVSILKYQYPTQMRHLSSIEDPEVPHEVEVNILFGEDHVILKTNDDILPSEILSQALSQLDLEEKVTEFCLKIFGREEFLLENVGLKNYQNIFNGSSNNEAFLVLKRIKEVSEKPPTTDIYTNIELPKRPRRNTDAFNTYQTKRKSITVLSTEIEDNLRVEIGPLKFPTGHNNELGGWRMLLRVSIYHGGDEIVKKLDINVEDISVEPREIEIDSEEMDDFHEVKSKMFEFDLPVQCIPRNAKMCFGLYKTDKKGKEKFLGWANKTIFDFQRYMKKVFSVFLWESENEEPSHNLLNPYKTTEDAFKKRNISTSIEVKLLNTFGCSIAFPEEERISWKSEMKTKGLETQDSMRRKTMTIYYEELEKISRRDPLHSITPKEKDLLRGLQDDCRVHHPCLLPRIIDCVNYTDYQEVLALHKMLRVWPLIPFQYALQLLDNTFPDERVHEYAIKCLNVEEDESLEMFFYQLVQALKHQNFFSSALCDFLLERAFNNQRLGHKLFWSLRCEFSSDVDLDQSTLKLVLILEAYLLGAPGHIEVLKTQKYFLVHLNEINSNLTLLDSRNPDYAKRNETFLDNIKRYIVPMTKDGFPSITDPSVKVKDVDVSQCSLMKSKMKPQKIFLKNFDSFTGMDKELPKISYIYKIGDDLRQDALVLQLLRIIDDLWKKSEPCLDLQMTTYNVVPTEHQKGVIEFVQNAETVCRIQMKESCINVSGDVYVWMMKATSAFKQNLIYQWLKRHNKSDQELEQALERFLLSCCGYTIAMYALGIGDRHNDNIMIKTNGKLFHIDFGHIMGNFKKKFGIKRERSKMVLPSEFIHVIQKADGGLERFRQLCERAFLVLRANGCLLISLLSMTLSSGMPELQSETDLEYMRTVLQLNDSISEEQALLKFRRDFTNSLNQSSSVTTNWWFHTMKQLCQKNA